MWFHSDKYFQLFGVNWGCFYYFSLGCGCCSRANLTRILIAIGFNLSPSCRCASVGLWRLLGVLSFRQFISRNGLIIISRGTYDFLSQDDQSLCLFVYQHEEALDAVIPFNAEVLERSCVWIYLFFEEHNQLFWVDYIFSLLQNSLTHLVQPGVYLSLVVSQGVIFYEFLPKQRQVLIFQFQVSKFHKIFYEVHTFCDLIWVSKEITKNRVWKFVIIYWLICSLCSICQFLNFDTHFAHVKFELSEHNIK